MAVESKRRRTGHPDLVDQDVADRKQYRQLRQHAFYGIAALIATLTIVLVTWTGSFGVRLFSSAYRTDPATSGLLLTPIAIVAALVAVPLLALIRFLFRESGPTKEEKNDLSIWQLLVKELSYVLKTYLGRSKPAA
ncbi:hypothetical protein AWB74_05348 [Caballeronia arvi]|uniref:Uncharacterized protein n=2 Tax=Caballeronia arvi TaxID=1777135 RepID=A0A158KBH4_9BURK|nr:hypothetical protein AWB74_05348 [Caballeronia arvi]